MGVQLTSGMRCNNNKPGLIHTGTVHLSSVLSPSWSIFDTLTWLKLKRKNYYNLWSIRRTQRIHDLNMDSSPSSITMLKVHYCNENILFATVLQSIPITNLQFIQSYINYLSDSPRAANGNVPVCNTSVDQYLWC